MKVSWNQVSATRLPNFTGSLSAPAGPQADKYIQVPGSIVLPAPEWIMIQAVMVYPPTEIAEPFPQS